MAHYRCYHISVDRHIIGVELFELPSDAEACARARAIASERRWTAHELWEYGRQVDCKDCN